MSNQWYHQSLRGQSASRLWITAELTGATRPKTGGRTKAVGHISHRSERWPFDAVTSPVVKDLVSGSGPHRKEHFYLLGFSRRQSTGSRHSGSTGLPRTTDGSFESSDPCLHRVSHAGPRSDDRNPGSEDLSEWSATARLAKKPTRRAPAHRPPPRPKELAPDSHERGGQGGRSTRAGNAFRLPEPPYNKQAKSAATRGKKWSTF